MVESGTRSKGSGILTPVGCSIATGPEKSGNGLRIFARYLWDQQLVGPDLFTVETPGGPVTCQVSDEGRIVSIDMGTVEFNSHEIPVAGPPREPRRV